MKHPYISLFVFYLLILHCLAGGKEALKVHTLSKGLTLQATEDVKMSSKKPAEDFDLFEFKKGTNILFNAYLGNFPDFPLEKGHGLKKASINRITVENTEYETKEGLHSREILFHLSDSRGWPQQLHCWYSGLNSSEAQEADLILSTVQQTRSASRLDSNFTSKQDKSLQGK